jgi:hypothetical protein
MKRREYRETSFNLPCNRQLWKTLGEFDALMQYVECAIISFEEKQEESGLTFQEFLKSQADKMSHPISSLSFSEPRQTSHNMFLVFPHSCLDTYIDGIIQNIRELGFSDFSLADTKGVSRLENLNTALIRAGVKPDLDNYNMLIYKYYRLLRNRLNHDVLSVRNVEIENAYKNVIKNKQEIVNRFRNPDALKEMGVLDFSDYILCTANIKNICDKFVISIEPHIKWENYTIKKENCKEIKRIKGLNEQRQLRYVSNYIASRFSKYPPAEACSFILSNTLSYIDTI